MPVLFVVIPSGRRPQAVEEVPDHRVGVGFSRHWIAGRNATAEPRVAATYYRVEPDDRSPIAPIPRGALRHAALSKGRITDAAIKFRPPLNNREDRAYVEGAPSIVGSPGIGTAVHLQNRDRARWAAWCVKPPGARHRGDRSD